MKLRFWYSITLFLAALVTGGGALADQLAAVGRLEYSPSRACTATLVRSDMVLTAAHCVAGHLAAGDSSPDTLSFRTGAYPDHPSIEIPVVDGVVHPLYILVHAHQNRRLQFDFALLKLERPVPKQTAKPLEITTEANKGERLFLASWRGNEGLRARERACPTLSGQRNLVTLGCRVRGGESGSPVMRLEDGVLKLVAVVSSRSNLLDQPTAQASNIASRLAPMMRALDAKTDN